eukprot:scaffold1439_cov282-Pinguiococcus_pyrenoidosus.AAC.11
MPNKEWAIRGLELPKDLSGKDDEHISSALGYAAHLVLMLSKYLAVPLRYQILYYSSRSAIRDEVRDGANARYARSCAQAPLFFAAFSCAFCPFA